MRALDRQAITGYGLKGLVLMENAGRGVAEVVKGVLEERAHSGKGHAHGACGGHGGGGESSGAVMTGARVSILAGKGNNGGDGFVAARHLKNAGHRPIVFSFASIDDIKGDAGVNARVWQKMGGEVRLVRSKQLFEKNASALKHTSVIVDALLGTGLSSVVKGLYKDVIEAINKLGKTVVSVDVPSGLDATTGKTLGAAIRATITATMAIPKVGLYLYPGREYAGRVEVLDIGIGMPGALTKGVETDFELIDESLVRSALSPGLLPSQGLLPRKKDSHKGTFGHTLVIGGSIGKTGAPYMSAMGAMRVGSGLSTIALPEGLNHIMEVKATEAMTHPLPESPGGTLGLCSLEEAKRALKSKAALIVGPGMAPSMEGSGDPDFVKGLLKASASKHIPVVMDADALNVMHGELAAIKDAAKKISVVLTPHPGEAARLLGSTTEEVQADRVSSALELSKKTGAVVVLKGASTLVTSGGRVFINPTGGPALASAGTGDVLAGMIGGFISQGAGSQGAAVAAVYIHGLASDNIAAKKGEAGLLATDLLRALPSLLNSFVAPGAGPLS